MYTDHQLAVIEAVKVEVVHQHPIRQYGLKYRSFWSYSAGRGKRRLRPKIIELVGQGKKWHQWHNYPFDTVATEIYGYSDDTVEDRLMRELRQYG